MDLQGRTGTNGQPLGVIPMAIALTAAAFLGGGLGLLFESGGSEDESKTAEATAE